MATSTLDIRIAAFIEGLKEVAALGDQFVKTAKQAESLTSAGVALDDLGKKATDAGSSLDKAFQTLGGSSGARIAEQINQIKAALDSVKSSGASFDDIARATEMAESKISSLNRELTNPAPKTFGEALTSIGQNLLNLDFGKVAAGVSTLASNFLGATTVIGTLVAGFKALVSIGEGLVNLIENSTLLAARVETLGVVLDVVGRNAGYSKETLAELDKGVQSMGITAEASRQALTQMIQAGMRISDLGTQFDKSGKQMTVAMELARAAQDAAVVSNENSSATLVRLITNIQQRNVHGLRWMGIIVDTIAAEEQYRVKMELTAGALTKTQQAQAFMNATLVELAKLSGTYESAMETLGKKLTSLVRFQDEFSTALGSNFTSAAGKAIDSLMGFLAQGTKLIDLFHASSTASDDMSKGLSPIVELLKEIGLAILSISLDVLGGMALVFKQIGQAIGDVAKDVGALLSGLGSLFSTGGEEVDAFLSKLDPIKGFFIGLALILAAVRDGMAVFAGATLEVIASFADVFSFILLGGAKVVGFFNRDLGLAMEASAASFKKFADRMDESASKTVKGLSDGSGALGQFVDGYGKLDTANNKTAANVALFSKKIEDLTLAQSGNKISAQQYTKDFEDISKAMFDVATNAGMTRKEYDDLNKQLMASAGAISKAFQESSTAAGLSLGTLRGSISKEVGLGVVAMDDLLKGAATKNEVILQGMSTSLTKVVADTINVFQRLVSQSKSIEDLIEVNNRLVEARRLGVLTEEEVQKQLTISSAKFEELFTAQLKSVKSQEGFERLTKAVIEMGNSGSISATAVSVALKKIEEAAHDAEGAVKSLREAQDALSTADQSLKVAQARYDILKSEMSIYKDRASILIAENQYYRDGSELSRLKWESAKLQYQLDLEGLALARTLYLEEVTSMDVLIQKQTVLNATRTLGLKDLTQEQRNAAELAKATAEDLGLQYQAQIASLKILADSQREHTLAIQGTKLQVDTEYEVLKQITAEEEKGRSGAEAHGLATAAASLKVQQLKGDVEGVTTAMGGLAGSQVVVTTGYGGMTAASATWATAAITYAQQVAAANAAAVQAGLKPDVTGKFVAGNGTITTEDGRVINLPKDGGVTPGLNNPIPSGGGLNTGTINQYGSSGGRGGSGTGGFNSTGGPIPDPHPWTASPTPSLSTIKPDNMTPVDNSGPFIAWDKYQAGTLTKTDEALVRGVWSASKANFTMMQQNTSAFGLEGIRDMTMWYNRARSMMGRLGLPAYQLGTDYVPQTGLANLHEGEAVLTKETNKAFAAIDWAGLTSMMSANSASFLGGRSSTAGGKMSGSDLGVSKKIQVEFLSGSKKVSALIDAKDESLLLNMLEQAKRVA